jgi:DNA-binding NarL/FixJ family response regulator
LTRTIPEPMSVGGGRGHAVLTVRQFEVMRALAHGMADKEIAAQLGISETAVRMHVRAAEARLQARTRAQAVARAVRQGLIA